MWASGSIEDMRAVYTNQGRHVSSGVWSVLLSQSRSDSLEFAERYFETFNQISLGIWHLNVFAKYNIENGAWSTDDEIHSHSLELRKKIEEITGKTLPPLCIVFLSGPSFLASDIDINQETIWAVLPLDHRSIANKNSYIAGLQATQSAITDCYREADIERYDAINISQSNYLIEKLQKKLANLSREEIFSCYIFKPAKWVALTLLAAILGLPVNAISGQAN